MARSKRMIYIILGFLAASIVFVIAEALWIQFNGQTIPRPEISRASQTLGFGPSLRYVVMGDSTAVAQGGDYTKGYASATAAYLAQSHTVTWQNVAVSGERAGGVLTHQVSQAVKSKPDVVVIAVGANDVTHLTPISSVASSLRKSIALLRQSNPGVRIILTGSPDMGSVPRFGQPVRWLAGKRTQTLNAMVVELAKEQQVIFAPIAEKTGPTFRAHPELFAKDKFHPTTQGYEVWIPVLIEALKKSGYNT